MTLYLDTETFSSVDISNGVYRYVEASDFEVMLISWAIDDGPARVWDRTARESIHPDLQHALQNDTIVAHNAQFDRVALARAGFNTDISQWNCTMARAYAHSLPGALGVLEPALGVPQELRKLEAGNTLINLFCKPLGKNRKLDRATKNTHPDEWIMFKEYARQDVAALRQLDKRLPRWNYVGFELNLWHLDQRINDQGMLLDDELLNAVITSAAKTKSDLDNTVDALTLSTVGAVTERDRLLSFINDSFGLNLKDLRTRSVERALESSELPDEARELLTLRLLGAKASVSKYKRASASVNEDGRVRGALQFCGASRTGRYAGRIVQPQNFPRPTVSTELIRIYRQAFKDGSIEILTDNPLQAAADCTRSMIIAPPGKNLLVGDYSNIEGRVLAWLADEEWKVEAFRQFDRGEAPDIYCLAFARAFGVSADQVSSDQRQIGKTMELAFGYGGGVGSLASMAEIYGISLDQIAETVLPRVDRTVHAEASDFYTWAIANQKDYSMRRDLFIACDCLKRLWRRMHPKTCALWTSAETAVTNHNGPVGVKCSADRVRTWTRVKLPSGRYLCYPHKLYDTARSRLTYWGVDQRTRKWSQLDTYGAKIVENITQAVARDILMHHFPGVQKVGRIILTVHDENVLEATPDKTPEELERAMLTPLEWAEGLPLAVKAFECDFYQKG